MITEIILLTGLLVGNCTITSYRSIQSQTDSSPYYTSTGEHVHSGGVAISRDLLCPLCRRQHKRCLHSENSRNLHYGDYIYISPLGLYKINDVMGESQYDRMTHKRIPIRNHFDIWVSSLQEEKAIKTQKRIVYIIKRTIR